MSDSHNMLDNMYYVLKNNNNIDCVVHLGDNYEDIKKVMELYKNIKFYGVRGNCDLNKEAPYHDLINVNNKRVLITHGHKNSVKSQYTNIYYFAKENEADICLFGHSHVPVIFKEDNIHFMNPGSISDPRMQPKCSYGICEINKKGEITMSIVEI
jgi:uncharacterized protein